jgi:transposase
LRSELEYTDVGTDYYLERDNPEVRKARLRRQLEELGYGRDQPRLLTSART